MATSESVQIRHIKAEPGKKVRGFVDVGETPVGPIRIPLVLIAGRRPGPTLCLTHLQHCHLKSIELSCAYRAHGWP